MTWRIETQPSNDRESELSERLVEHNVQASEIVRRRFEPQHLACTPIQRFAVDESGTLVGGCAGRSEDLWHCSRSTSRGCATT